MAKADFFDSEEPEVEIPDLDAEADSEGVDQDGSKDDEGKQSEEDKKSEKSEDKDDDVDIQVDEDPLFSKPNWDAAAKLKGEKDEDYGKRVQKRMGELKAAGSELQRQLEQQRAVNAELIKAYKAQEAKSTDLEKKLQTGTLNTLKRSQESEERAAAIAKKNLSEALALGDVAKVTEAQEALAQATVNVARVKERIQEKEEQAEAPKVATKTDADPEPRVQAPPAMPQSRIEWFRRNPWFSVSRDENGNMRGNDDLSSHALAAHSALVQKGIQPDSAQYFAAIDKSLRAKFPERFGVAKPTAPVPPSSRVSPNAQSRVTSANGKKTYRFSSSELETAKSLGFTTKAQLARYAEEILKSNGSKE